MNPTQIAVLPDGKPIIGTISGDKILGTEQTSRIQTEAETIPLILVSRTLIIGEYDDDMAVDISAGAERAGYQVCAINGSSEGVMTIGLGGDATQDIQPGESLVFSWTGEEWVNELSIGVGSEGDFFRWGEAGPEWYSATPIGPSTADDLPDGETKGITTLAGMAAANDIGAATGATTDEKINALVGSLYDPKSIAGSADTDLGRFRRFLGAANAAAVLPAGGTWEYALTRRGPNMQIVGSGLALTAFSGGPTLAALNGNDFAFIDGTNDSLRTYRFDGSTFTAIGSALALSGISSPKIKALSATRVVMYDSGTTTLRAYDWDAGAGTWSLVGNPLTITGAGVGAIAKLTATTVAFIDVALDALTTYAFDGTDWAATGTPLTIAIGGGAGMARMSDTRIAMLDYSTDLLRAIDWDPVGGTWTALPGTLSISHGAPADLAQISATRIVEIDGTNKKLREYEYANNAWTQVGAGVPITGIGNGVAVAYLVPDNLPYGYVIFADNTLDRLMAFDYDGSLGRAFEEVSSVAAGGSTVGTAVDGYYWSGWIKRIAS